MKTEVLSYSVVVAILGMAVVFGFLWFLSVLMSTIKAMFGERPQRDDPERAESPSTPKRPATESVDGVPQWVLAAVAAYVIEEELDAQRSAEAWIPDPSAFPDAWTAAPRF